MSVYNLSNYLFVCENHFLGIGCGTELVVEQKRSIEAAAAAVAAQGWEVHPPSPFDDDRVWSSLCSYCSNMRKVKLAEWKAKEEARAAAGLGKP